MSPSQQPPLRIGMVGAGTVGGGVYEIIMGRLGGSSIHPDPSSPTPPPPSSVGNPSSRKCVISKICVRDPSKTRTFHLDTASTTIVTDISEIMDDESIDMIVEVMGGTTVAKSVVLEGLRRGKSVVTANKALIAEHLDEIQRAVVKGGGRMGLGYESSVCGGIPIIQGLQSCYMGDIIHEVTGICNGTTNYMLGKMEGGADYDQVLREAQDLGFAEADPTADVEGHDVRAKIAILAKLAFGTTVSIDQIPCMGITKLTEADFDYARRLGCTIKLVGTAVRLSKFGEHDGALSVYVAPKLVPSSHFLASAQEGGNAVAVHSANLGITSYAGPGAGRFPTANSVVADICRIAAGGVQRDPFPLSSDIEVDGDFTAPFYIRISFQDGIGIIRMIGEIAECHRISIDSIIQNPIKNRIMADFVVVTEECKHSQVQAFCIDVEKQEFVLSEPLCMPLLIETP